MWPKRVASRTPCHGRAGAGAWKRRALPYGIPRNELTPEVRRPRTRPAEVSTRSVFGAAAATGAPSRPAAPISEVVVRSPRRLKEAGDMASLLAHAGGHRKRRRPGLAIPPIPDTTAVEHLTEIGRASCRERRKVRVVERAVRN